MKKVASVSRPKKLARGSRTGRRETEETFNSHQNIYFFCFVPSITYVFSAPVSLAFPGYVQIVERQRGPLAQPPQFLSWPGCAAFEGRPAPGRWNAPANPAPFTALH